jgi:hypothetical protein
MATICVERLRRKVSHRCEGEAGRLIMFFATLDWATSAIRHGYVERATADYRRSSVGSTRADQDRFVATCRSGLPTPVALKTGTVPPHEGLGSNDPKRIRR